MGLPPLRVEQALRLLPDVDALMPLRAYLISSSRARASAEPHRTVGKRYVQPDDLRELVPEALRQVKEHLEVLYSLAVEALEAEQRDDMPAAVRALLEAGEREEEVGRDKQARAWYDHALRVAEGLRERKPEIEALRRLGRLEASRGQLDAGARHYQRSEAVASAEFDNTNAALACQGLGEIWLAQSKWQGAESWFRRGLRYADDDRRLSGHLLLGQGEVARRRGQLETAADLFRRARVMFDEAKDAEGIVRSVNAWGLLEKDRGRHDEALSCFRDGLARLHTMGDHPRPRLEMAIRLNLCELFLDWNRLPDAEDEVRRAEETAIQNNFSRQLARLYVIMGRVRGLQGDETGFVFFEKAIELAQGGDPAPRQEAEIYRAYAEFRRHLGEHEEAAAYLERARELLVTVGDGARLAEIDEDLSRLHRDRNGGEEGERRENPR